MFLLFSIVLRVRNKGDDDLGPTIFSSLYSVPDLGLGTLGTCPGASTRKGLQKSINRAKEAVLLDFVVRAASRTRSNVLAQRAKTAD